MLNLPKSCAQHRRDQAKYFAQFFSLLAIKLVFFFIACKENPSEQSTVNVNFYSIIVQKIRHKSKALPSEAIVLSEFASFMEFLVFLDNTKLSNFTNNLFSVTIDALSAARQRQKYPKTKTKNFFDVFFSLSLSLSLNFFFFFPSIDKHNWGYIFYLCMANSWWQTFCMIIFWLSVIHMRAHECLSSFIYFEKS